GTCHVLFVARDELALLPAIRKTIADRNTLLVTDYPDALEDGSVVNFVVVDNVVKYEISLPNARKHRLEVGSTLVQLAYVAQQ
ncbi:MAG TPA: YfiR family protein, partial [Flavobacteriales bacterium]|nr:YfiR family protein [Flavobacteriales bacterium]